MCENVRPEEVSQFDKSWLKLVAPWNLCQHVTKQLLRKDHCNYTFRTRLFAWHHTYMLEKSVTAEVSHWDKSSLKLGRDANKLLISSTLETSHDPMSVKFPESTAARSCALFSKQLVVTEHTVVGAIVVGAAEVGAVLVGKRVVGLADVGGAPGTVGANVVGAPVVGAKVVGEAVGRQTAHRGVTGLFVRSGFDVAKQPEFENIDETAADGTISGLQLHKDCENEVAPSNLRQTKLGVRHKASYQCLFAQHQIILNMIKTSTNHSYIP